MLHGLVGNENPGGRQTTNQTQPRRKGSRNFHIGPDLSAQAKGPAVWQNKPSRKPPCACCSSPYRGVWSCRDFKQKSWDNRWQLVKNKRLCFRCLAGDHQGKMCTRSQLCQIGGCRGNHHRLLHEVLPINRKYLTRCTGGGNITGGRTQLHPSNNDDTQPQDLRGLLTAYCSCVGKGERKEDQGKCNHG